MALKEICKEKDLQYKSLISLEEQLSECVRKKRLRKGIKLIKRFELFLREKNYTDDILVGFLQASSRYFIEFDKKCSYVSVLFKLSYLYIDVGAFQTAYRTIDELLELACNRKSIKLIAKVYDLYLVALLKERDIDNALSLSDEITNSIGWDFISKNTAHNIAVAFLKSEKYYQAIDILERLECSSLDLSEFNLSCRLNLAICYREIEDFDKSISILEELDYYYMPSLESQIEFELVYAKSLIVIGCFYDAISRLINAISHIEDFLQDIYKVYYRRGVREYYVHRIERLIISMPVEQFDNRVLSVLIFTRQNQCSDWMNLLDWSDEIFASINIEEADKIKLKDKIRVVASSGAPFKYGMREKYDDHHDRIYNGEWSELSDTISNIRTKYGKDSPFMKCKNDVLSGMEDRALLVSFLEVSNKVILFHNNEIIEACLDSNVVERFVKSFGKYKRDDINNVRFSEGLIETINSLDNSMQGIVSCLCKKCPKELIYFSDKYESIPIVSIFYKNTELLNNLASGAFSFKITPILYYKKRRDLPQLDNVVGISDDSLALSSEEIYSFATNINCSVLDVFKDQSDKELLLEKIEDADVLHVTTHGEPIDYYADPAHARLNSGHLINTNLIQSKFFKYKYGLCLLNSCHSSSNLIRRQISLFDNSLNMLKSYDTFSFPRLILINRKSSCISSSWRTFDKYSYVLSLNISKYISQGKEYNSALTQSIARMILAEENEIIGELIPINDKNLNKLGDASTLRSMFRHPYCYATYHCIATL